MPEVDAAEIRSGLTVRDIPGLFTVATFVRLVEEQMGGVTEDQGIADADVAAASLAHDYGRICIWVDFYGDGSCFGQRDG